MAEAEALRPSRLTAQSIAASLAGTHVPESGDEDHEPLNHTTSASQLNRDRFEQNRRHVAAQVLQFSLPAVVCIVLLALSLLVAFVFVYVKGWWVLLREWDKTCDQPLKWWLLVMLCYPFVDFVVKRHAEIQQNNCLKLVQAHVTPILIVVGVFCWWHCKTCQKTNPELYECVKLYLICSAVISVVLIFSFFGFVTLVLWLHRHGLLDNGPGPAMAARPGLIRNIETVPFTPSLFSETPDDAREPPECCICQEVFSPSRSIKRTPCRHFFHEDCLKKWLEEYAKSCPVCRDNLEERFDPDGEGALAAAEAGEATGPDQA